MCDASLPEKLANELIHAEESAQPKIGAKWAKEQVDELLNKGAPGFHLYALNQSASSLEILNGLRKQGS
jgi:methylenetetrahydrofolate reductase (NADPH)